MKRRHWLRWTLLGLLLALCILVALLPTLLSLDGVRKRVLTAINKHSDIKVNVDAWSLKWFGSMQLQGMTVSDPARGTTLYAEHIHTGAGIAALLRNPMDVGSLTAGGAWIRMTNPHGPPLLLNRIQLALRTADHDAPASLTFSAQQGGGEGSISMESTFRLRDTAAAQKRNLNADGKLTLANIDVASLTAFFPHKDIPAATGTLDGMAIWSAPSVNAFDLRGKLELKALTLSGGPLQTDTPSLDLTEMDFHIAENDNQTTVETLRLTSPIGSVHAGGTLTARTHQHPIGNLTAQATLDIAALANQLPATLSLRRGLQLVGGQVLFNITYAGTEDAMNCATVIKTQDIKARLDKQEIRLDAPIKLTAVVTDNASGLRLSSLNLSSSFSQATGSGNLTNLHVDLVADLAKATAEAGKFADLGDMGLKGGLTASINAKQVTERSRRISLDANLRNFTMDKADAKPVYQRRVKLTMDGLLNLTSAKRFKDLTDLTAGINANTGAIALTAKRLVPVANRRLPDISGLVCRVRANLSAANGTNTTTKINGSIVMNARGSIENDVVNLPDITCTGSDISLTRGNATWTESDLTLRAKLLADLPKNVLALGALELTTQTLAFKGSGTLTDLDGAQWLALKGTVTPDFERLALMLAALTKTRIEMEGREARDLSLHMSLAGDDTAHLLSQMEGSLGVYIKRLTCCGVEITELDPTITLRESRLTTTLNADVSHGTLLLPLTLDLHGQQPMLTIANKTHVLTSVPITDDMVSDLLSRLHPALSTCTATKGTADLFLESFSMPLGENLKRDTVITGRLVLSDVELAPRGMLKDLLVLAENKADPVTLERQEISFTCKNGRLTSSPLVLHSHGNTLTFRGSTGLDGSLRYVAELPITKDMVNDKVYPYLKDTVIRLDIGGSVKDPKISRHAFRKALQDLVRDASRTVIQGDLKNTLKEELKGKVRDKDLEQGLKLLDQILQR